MHTIYAVLQSAHFLFDARCGLLVAPGGEVVGAVIGALFKVQLHGICRIQHNFILFRVGLRRERRERHGRRPPVGPRHLVHNDALRASRDRVVFSRDYRARPLVAAIHARSAGASLGKTKRSTIPSRSTMPSRSSMFPSAPGWAA